MTQRIPWRMTLGIHLPWCEYARRLDCMALRLDCIHVPLFRFHCSYTVPCSRQSCTLLCLGSMAHPVCVTGHRNQLPQCIRASYGAACYMHDYRRCSQVHTIHAPDHFVYMTRNYRIYLIIFPI